MLQLQLSWPRLERRRTSERCLPEQQFIYTYYTVIGWYCLDYFGPAFYSTWGQFTYISCMMIGYYYSDYYQPHQFFSFSPNVNHFYPFLTPSETAALCCMVLQWSGCTTNLWSLPVLVTSSVYPSVFYRIPNITTLLPPVVTVLKRNQKQQQHKQTKELSQQQQGKHGKCNRNNPKW